MTYKMALGLALIASSMVAQADTIKTSQPVRKPGSMLTETLPLENRGAHVIGMATDTIAATPEPNSLFLLGTGFVVCAGLMSLRRRPTSV